MFIQIQSVFRNNTNMRLFLTSHSKFLREVGFGAKGTFYKKFPSPRNIFTKIFLKLNNYILQKFVQIFAANDNVQRYTVCVVFVGQRL